MVREIFANLARSVGPVRANFFFGRGFDLENFLALRMSPLYPVLLLQHLVFEWFWFAGTESSGEVSVLERGVNLGVSIIAMK